MTKWVVTGFYGQGNFGDDLFCYVMAKLMEEHGQDYLIQNGFINSKSRINCSQSFFFRKYIARKGWLGKIARISSIFFAGARGENIVFGGGSVFGRYASYRQRKIACILASFLNRKLFAFGVSLGPFEGKLEEEKYAAILRKFNLIVTRDESSHRISDLFSLKGKRACDMVFSIPDFHKKKDANSKALVIALHELSSVEALFLDRAWLRKFERVTIIALDGKSKGLSASIKQYADLLFLNKTRLIDFGEAGIEEVLNEISSASFVITSKLHGAITAAAYGVRFTLLEYQEKCTELLRSLNGFEPFYNFGNESLFIQNIGRVYESLEPSEWNLEGRRDEVVQSFRKMLNAGG